MDEDLRAEAQSNGITVTSLISSIISRYLAVDRNTKTLETVNISRKWFSNIIDAVDEESFKKYYPQMQDAWRARIEFREAEALSFESFWKALENTGIYSGLFQCNAVRTDQRFSLTLHHSFGQKWSNFLEYQVTNTLVELNVKTLNQSNSPASITISGEVPCSNPCPKNPSITCLANGS